MGWWSSIKKAVKKVVTVVKAVVRVVVKVVVEIVSRVLNSIAQIFLYWKEKNIRLVIIILRDEAGDALIQENDKDLQIAIQYAKKTFKDRMNTQIKPYGTLIQTLPDPAPTAALGVDCEPTARGTGISVAGAAVGGMLGVLGGPIGIGIGIAIGFGIGSALSGKTSGGAIFNEFSEAGNYFAKHTAGWGWFRMNLYYPITVFIVKEITGKIGCSLGPLTDYVTLSIKGVSSKSTLAHELGHCCGLLHRDDEIENLMYPGKERTDNKITGWQKYIARTSRHCTFW
jgi:hypothetical protein